MNVNNDDELVVAGLEEEVFDVAEEEVWKETSRGEVQLGRGEVNRGEDCFHSPTF